MVRYVYVLDNEGNGFLIDYEGLDYKNVGKFLIYLYNKGYKFYHFPSESIIIVEAKDGKIRKRLKTMMDYYSLKGEGNIQNVVIINTELPGWGSYYKITESDGEYKLEAVEVEEVKEEVEDYPVEFVYLDDEDEEEDWDEEEDEEEW